MDKIGKKDFNMARAIPGRLAGKTPAVLLIITVCLVIVWSAPAWATSASISASESNGPVSVTASASFTAYENCDNEEPPNCTTNSSGSLATYRNGAHIITVGGDGSATWSNVYNAATWANGIYTFKAVATDSKSNTGVSESSVTIDNTPTASVSSPGQPSGPVDPSGNASFKNNIEGYDGLIGLEVDRTPTFTTGTYKSCEGSCSVSYSDFPNHNGLLETALLTSGDHALHILARSSSGLSASDSVPFTVDNIPKISAGVSGELSGPVDVSATVELKEYSKGTDGIVAMEVDQTPSFANLNHYKSCDGNCNVKYSDIYVHYGPLETALLKTGAHSLVVKAFNKVSESATESYPFTVDNIPIITSGVSGELSGPVDVSATVELKEYSKGNDGIVAMEVDQTPSFANLNHYKSCDGNCNVKYSDIYVHYGPLETALLKTGAHSLVVKAFNKVSESATESYPFTVDNIPIITSGVSGELSGPVDVSATVELKEYSKGTDGIVAMEVDQTPSFANLNHYKSCDGNCNVKYSDIYVHYGPLETALLKTGAHSLVVKAFNKVSESATESYPFTVDNLPKIESGVSGELSGPVDVSATVKLNEYSKGWDGLVTLGVDSAPGFGSASYYKTCDEGGSCSVKYSDISAHPSPVETAILNNGNHNLVVRAYNRAAEEASASFPFTIDNTPHPQVNSPAYVSGPFSITGMVSFKEYSKGAEGTVYVAIDSPTMAGNKSKTLEGASASYTFTGYNAATMTKGKHTVYARALSVNGTWSEIVHADFEVGEPDPLRENVQNKIKDAAQAPAN